MTLTHEVKLSILIDAPLTYYSQMLNVLRRLHPVFEKWAQRDPLSRRASPSSCSISLFHYLESYRVNAESIVSLLSSNFLNTNATLWRLVLWRSCSDVVD